jgi:ubiquinone/menaquinone biosynthesis C-methylase UbiE
LNNAVKTRPDRYRDNDYAVAYHRSTNANKKLRLSQRLEIDALSKALQHTQNATQAIDVPCGTGRIDNLLRQSFESVVGLDSSVPMLSVYRQSDDHRLAGCADIFNLPFDDNAFDWAICHRYFHHLQTDAERVAVLSSLSRVARRGVIFYLWLNTPLASRKSMMRCSISEQTLRNCVDEAGLTMLARYNCGWPFSVKSIVVCSTEGK